MRLHDKYCTVRRTCAAEDGLASAGRASWSGMTMKAWMMLGKDMNRQCYGKGMYGRH